MSLEQKPDGRWFLDIEPVKGKRYRRNFKTKAEALRFEALVRHKLTSTKDWNPSPKDRRRLSELVERWFGLHGHTLTDGTRRRDILRLLCQELGNPIAADMTGSLFTEARKSLLENGVAGKTLNNRLGYLKAVYNELYQLEDISYPNPLEKVRALRLQERPISYLVADQIHTLLFTIESKVRLPHVSLITRICLVTGARWSEAQGLTPQMVRNSSVTFINTKSKRTRTIPITVDMEAELLTHFRRYGLFTNCLSTFGRIVEAAGIELPAGQSSHVLRHTFASHFMMNGGNILTLQKILGHASLAMTMRYAHLSPDHFQDAVKLNPLSTAEGSSTLFRQSPDSRNEKPLISNRNQGLTLNNMAVREGFEPCYPLPHTTTENHKASKNNDLAKPKNTHDHDAAQ